MKKVGIALFMLITAISYAEENKKILNYDINDNRKILNYDVNKDEKNKYIVIKVDEDTFNYKIIWGDTLSEIAEELNTKVEKLAEDNKIEDINLIYAGDDLIVEKKHNNYKEKIQ